MKITKEELIQMYTYIRIQIANTKDHYLLMVLDNINTIINEVEQIQKIKEIEDFEKQYRSVKQDEN
jgi:hypothetical protein